MPPTQQRWCWGWGVGFSEWAFPRTPFLSEKLIYLGFPAAATAKSLQSCPTLCNPIDGSPSSSTVPGILQARTLEQVAISFSIAWKWKVKVKSFSHVRLLATPWTAAYQAPPSMGFSRQEYWSGVPLASLVAGKESDCNAGDLGSIPGLGRSPGEENGYPLQYSGLENSMGSIVHWVTKSWTRSSVFPFTHQTSHLSFHL